jgi:signal peptidase
MAKKKNDNAKVAKARRIANVLGNLLFVLVLLIGLAVVFSLLPIKNNYKLYTVMSGSMEPKIPVGGLVAVRPVQQYVIGDVITYTVPGSREKTTHRIYAINSDENGSSYTTKGDANSDPDGTPVYPNQIIGKQFVVVPLLGYVINYVKTPVGLVLIIIIPSAIIVYEEIKKIIREAQDIIKKRRSNKKRKATK